MNKKRMIVANWKMNPRTLREAREIFRAVKRKADTLTKVQTVICPPFVFLSPFSSSVTSRFLLGAQDAFPYNPPNNGGAYTGEISPAQLRALGVSHVILGHSERRALDETNEIIQKKIKAAFEYRLNVILCVGEPERDGKGHYLSFLKDEIKKSLGGVRGKEMGRLFIAYEPIWAVGTAAKAADTPDVLFEVVIFIRKVLSDLFGKSVAFQIPILYGGSVTARNAESFLKDGGVSGLLVGRAGLDPKEFNEILEIAQNI